MKKEIPRFEGKYFCDISGNIYNKNKQLKPFKGNGGYYRISLNKKKYSVHRLVAETFLKNPDNNPYCDHINREPLDNRLENLRWATGTENNMNRSNTKIDGTTPTTN